MADGSVHHHSHSEMDEGRKELLSPDTNLVLIGLRGSGKSKIGEMVKMELGSGWDFIDTDRKVQEKLGPNETIADLLETTEGTKRFRDLETEVLQHYAGRPKQVIATGGGIVEKPVNRAILKQHNMLCMWMKAKLTTLDARTKNDPNRPPIYKDAADSLDDMRRVATAREPFFQELKPIAINAELGEKEVMKEVLTKFKEKVKVK